MQPARQEASHSHEGLQDVVYGRARHGDAETDLHCALFLPDAPVSPPALFVWFHGGAFKYGHHKQRMCLRLGRRLSRAGIAVASVQYRLRCTDEDLSETVRDRAEDLQAHKADLIRKGLCQTRSLGALEDGVRFLDWAADQADVFGWSGQRVLGGSSAGGITAFNMVYSARFLGLNDHEIDGVFATTGGYNYPALVDPDLGLDVLALHNPLDDRVTIDGVRMLRDKLGDKMILLESKAHIHGHCELESGERPYVIYGRIADFVRRATAN